MEDNPCLKCTINQGCCSDLKGLRLSPQEYERHFAHHSEALLVRRDGPQYQVTATAGPCPNWHGRCTVYETRPMECRLFPMTISNVAKVGETVVVVAHDRTSCPQSAALRPSDAQAQALIAGFVREAYGEGRPMRLVIDAGLGRAAAFGVKVLNRLVKDQA
jgi:Fe-S-cluster containining protein